MDISIIIPIFNAEKYIKRCVDSVISSCKNSKLDFEILLINNNSTDKSLEIIKSYKERYPNFIKVLNCKTWGASAVRNYGILESKGKYIWFIDTDDEIMPGSVKKLVDEAEKTNADLVMMGAKRMHGKHLAGQLTAVDPKKPDYKSRFVRYGAGPWQFLIKRAWWNKNNFKFHEGIIHEDMELMSSLILHTDNFSSVEDVLYIYYQNEESVLHKAKYDPHIFDIFPALEGLYKKFTEAKAEKQYHDELEWFFIWNLLIDSAKDFGSFPEGKVGFSRSRKMLKKYFPNWRRNRFLAQKSLKTKMRVFLNYYGITF